VRQPERGERALKGVPGTWQLYAVDSVNNEVMSSGAPGAFRITGLGRVLSPDRAEVRGRGGRRLYDAGVSRFLHTMCRITDPEKSRRFYEALGFTFAGDFDIVRNGELEATNYFFSLGDQDSVLELTYNHDGRTYDLGTGYGHIAVAADDLDEALAALKEQGIEPEREPYRVREGGSRICFVKDPDGYRIELIDRSRR
jgi:lactoylglutathione lyase